MALCSKLTPAGVGDHTWDWEFEPWSVGYKASAFIHVTSLQSLTINEDHIGF